MKKNKLGRKIGYFNHRGTKKIKNNSIEKYYIYIYLNDLLNKLRRKESRLKPVVDRFGNTKNMIDQ